MMDLNSFVCALTGKALAGAGQDVVEAPLSDDVKIQVRVFVQTARGRFEQAKVGDEAAAAIRAAMDALKKRSGK